jgi:hypothetical protein
MTSGGGRGKMRSSLMRPADSPRVEGKEAAEAARLGGPALGVAVWQRKQDRLLPRAVSGRRRLLR